MLMLDYDIYLRKQQRRTYESVQTLSTIRSMQLHPALIIVLPISPIISKAWTYGSSASSNVTLTIASQK